MKRECNGCTLCCKLIPMKRDAERAGEIMQTIPKMVEAGWATADEFDGMLFDFDKPAGQRCRHQCSSGCKVYDRRPFGCRTWNCRWLVSDDTADLSRPDRSRVVIDIIPDFIVMSDDETGQRSTVEVIQVWCDPKQRDAWRTPSIMAFLDRRGKEGKAAIIRYSECDARIVFPPSMSRTGQWREDTTGIARDEWSPQERLAGVASASRVTVP